MTVITALFLVFLIFSTNFVFSKMVNLFSDQAITVITNFLLRSSNKLMKIGTFMALLIISCADTVHAI